MEFRKKIKVNNKNFKFIGFFMVNGVKNKGSLFRIDRSLVEVGG